MKLSRACVVFALASAGVFPSQSQTAGLFASASQSGRIIALTAGDIARLGLQSRPLEPASYTPRVHGYGVVVDLSALAQADANVTTARVAARQSRADLIRTRNLFRQNKAVSRQALDLAEKQAATDAAQLLLAERQELVQFGPQAPWRGAHPDLSLLALLTSGRAVLVRATFPLDSIGPNPTRMSVSHLSAEQDLPGWSARRIWSAPADPTIPGRSYFALVSGSDLQSGEHVLVNTPTGPASQGVRIPSEAVILSDSQPWCYIETSIGSFQRIPIDLSKPLPGGYFVANRFGPGRSVVVRGAGLLLSRELGVATLPRD